MAELLEPPDDEGDGQHPEGVGKEKKEREREEGDIDEGDQDEGFLHRNINIWFNLQD